VLHQDCEPEDSEKRRRSKSRRFWILANVLGPFVAIALIGAVKYFGAVIALFLGAVVYIGYRIAMRPRSGYLAASPDGYEEDLRLRAGLDPQASNGSGKRPTARRFEAK
jgi:nitrate reductase NapE component